MLDRSLRITMLAILLSLGATLAAAQQKETEQEMLALFDTIDADHDGTISYAEWAAYAISVDGRAGEKARQEFIRIDANHDAIIERSEWIAWVTAQYVHGSGSGGKAAG